MDTVHGVLLALIVAGSQLFPYQSVSAEQVIDSSADSHGLMSFDLHIEDRQIKGSLKTITVKQGQRVRLLWLSEEDVNIHLHGYDLQLDLIASMPAEMIFSAYATGRFSITSHGFGKQEWQGGEHHHSALIYLEVHPD